MFKSTNRRYVPESVIHAQLEDVVMGKSKKDDTDFLLICLSPTRIINQCLPRPDVSSDQREIEVGEDLCIFLSMKSYHDHTRGAELLAGIIGAYLGRNVTANEVRDKVGDVGEVMAAWAKDFSLFDGCHVEVIAAHKIGADGRPKRYVQTKIHRLADERF